jgi:regulatory protein
MTLRRSGRGLRGGRHDDREGRNEPPPRDGGDGGRRGSREGRDGRVSRDRSDPGDIRKDAGDSDAGEHAAADVPESADHDDTGRQAYAKALGLLSRREHSQRELRRKLDRKGFAADESAAALQDLQRQSFQSDQRFAQMLVRSRVSQGQGPRRILAELRTHGITDVDARDALEQEGTDWLVLARRIHARRYGQAAGRDPQESRRRAAFLLRRGFDAATVRAITHADDVDDSAEEFD